MYGLRSWEEKGTVKKYCCLLGCQGFGEHKLYSSVVKKSLLAQDDDHINFFGTKVVISITTSCEVV